MPKSAPAVYGWVLTRLHSRYSRETLGDDLVLTPAPAIMGGRGDGPTAAVPSTGDNNFQGRYIVHHPWKGPLACALPRRGNWGGPPVYDQRPALPPLVRDPEVVRGKIDLATAIRTPLAAGASATPGAPRYGEPPSPARRFRLGMTFGVLLGAALAAVVSARSRRRERSTS
jgi:hypothetical protein